MVKEGIIDPTKVVRSALQNAASVATLLLTSDALIADDAEGRQKKAAAAAAATTTCIERTELRHEARASVRCLVLFDFCGSDSGCDSAPPTPVCGWPKRARGRSGCWFELLQAVADEIAHVAEGTRRLADCTRQ